MVCPRLDARHDIVRCSFFCGGRGRAALPNVQVECSSKSEVDEREFRVFLGPSVLCWPSRRNANTAAGIMKNRL